MSDPIDPRLQYASSLPPRTLSQSYTSGPGSLQHTAQPYYLPTPTAPPPASQPSVTAPQSIDPALETSPAGHELSHDEDDDEEGDHDG